MHNKKMFLIIIGILIIIGLTVALRLKNNQPEIKVINLSPSELEKQNLIRLDTPHADEIIKSPLTIRGEARGNWFFEGSFPVILTNWDGLIIAESIATAQSDWMTTDFVPFTATLTFQIPTYKNNGSLILKKDNPSGLPQNDDALEIPVLFEKRKN